MSQKVFYRYNPASNRYERVYPTRRERLWAGARRWLISLGVMSLVLAGLYAMVDFPRERELRRENDRINSRLGLFSNRTDEDLAVMYDLADRDDNFYRVMMHAEPLSASQRFAGLDRRDMSQRLDSMSDNSLLAGVETRIEQLEGMIYSQSRSYDYLLSERNNIQDRMSHIPAIPPISEKYLRAMASGYGYRSDPIYGTMKFHEGMDFSSPIGTPVYATGDGTVTTGSWQSAYGNLVEINHGYNYTTRYAHLSRIDVRPGQQVKRGDQIGLVGNTGKSTGSHLHYEVRLRGAPQNPVNYYFYDLTPEQYDEMIRLAENAGHVMD